MLPVNDHVSLLQLGKRNRFANSLFGAFLVTYSSLAKQLAFRDQVQPFLFEAEAILQRVFAEINSTLPLRLQSIQIERQGEQLK